MMWWILAYMAGAAYIAALTMAYERRRGHEHSDDEFWCMLCGVTLLTAVWPVIVALAVCYGRARLLIWPK